MTASRGREFVTGAQDTIPMILRAVPFGIIYGALAINAGLTPTAALGMSLFVFAGSAQFLAVGLVSQGAAPAVIVLTTFVVNLRHALYSASLAPYLKNLPQTWLVPLAFWLTDETYAVVIRRFQHAEASPYRHWYYLGSALSMYINWNLCTLIGMIAGQQLEGLTQLGLDFAMTVTFIGIVVPLISTRPMLLCACTAGLVGVLANNMPHKLGLIVAAVCGIAVGLLADEHMKRQVITTSIQQENR
jgi:4-azaleucine resistance transporter AzlC